MKNLILLIILFYCSSLFSQTGLITVNETTIYETQTSPQLGLAGKIGSIALLNTQLGSVYNKTGDNDRDWELLSDKTQTNLIFYDDFISTLAAGLLNFTTTTAGGGSSCQTSTVGINSTNKALGVLNCDSGTTATGRTTHLFGSDSLLFGYANLRVQSRLSMNILSTALQRFTIYQGFIDTTGAGDQVDGAYFRYIDSVNSGRWECVTSNNSVRTVSDSGVAANTSWNIFEVNVNEAGTSATFYINGTLVCTNAANIPTVAGRNFSSGHKIEKSVGGTRSDIFIDWYRLQIVYSNSR